MKEKREQILKQIVDEESEKAKIQQELAALTQRLARINESLARKVCGNRHCSGAVMLHSTSTGASCTVAVVTMCAAANTLGGVLIQQPFLI